MFVVLGLAWLALDLWVIPGLSGELGLPPYAGAWGFLYTGFSMAIVAPWARRVGRHAWKRKVNTARALAFICLWLLLSTVLGVVFTSLLR